MMNSNSLFDAIGRAHPTSRKPARALGMALIALTACNSPVGVSSPIAVQLTANREVASADNPVTFTVTVINVSYKSVSMADAGSMYCAQPLEIRDDKGGAVQLPDRYCTAELRPPRILAPGETLTFDDQWATVRRGEGFNSQTPVSSGRYTIRANIRLTSNPSVSNEISIAVVNPQ